MTRHRQSKCLNHAVVRNQGSAAQPAVFDSGQFRGGFPIRIGPEAQRMIFAGREREGSRLGAHSLGPSSAAGEVSKLKQ
jgi:hypothetical protein